MDPPLWSRLKPPNNRMDWQSWSLEDESQWLVTPWLFILCHHEFDIFGCQWNISELFDSSPCTQPILIRKNRCPYMSSVQVDYYNLFSHLGMRVRCRKSGRDIHGPQRMRLVDLWALAFHHQNHHQVKVVIWPNTCNFHHREGLVTDGCLLLMITFSCNGRAVVVLIISCFSFSQQWYIALTLDLVWHTLTLSSFFFLLVNCCLSCTPTITHFSVSACVTQPLSVLPWFIHRRLSPPSSLCLWLRPHRRPSRCVSKLPPKLIFLDDCSYLFLDVTHI